MERTRTVLAEYQPRHVDLNEAMQAAVLLPLYMVDGRYHILLTRRSDTVEHHKNEISFPGGSRDDGDADLVATALREAHEEIGLHPEHVEVLGHLDDLVTRTNFRIRPYVGLITQSPYPFLFDPAEVRELLTIPLDHLYSPEGTSEFIRVIDGQERTTWSYLWQGNHVFGATAAILKQFLKLLQEQGTAQELVLLED